MEETLECTKLEDGTYVLSYGQKKIYAKSWTDVVNAIERWMSEHE